MTTNAIALRSIAPARHKTAPAAGWFGEPARVPAQQSDKKSKIITPLQFAA